MTGSRLAGKICIVTGAGSGIGATTATVFAQHGAGGVVCADLSAEAARATAAAITVAGGNASPFAMDVSDEKAAVALVEHTRAVYGRVDVLHNNAAMAIPGSVHETSLEDWNRVLAVNITGAFLVSRAVLRIMLEQRSGAIVNTCSNHATVASPRLASYHASKGAIRALTRQMALDYAPDIRVNCVSPGLVDTPAARGVRGGTDAVWARKQESNRYFKRAAQPREIAYGVLYLASDEASFLTGHDLVMSGGQGEVAF
ncbi:SDR family NAD(P)-dependent oxidoreductase [Saccharopolyspora spinosa]|uniref:NADP-dependent 3-hydroxy acid dehydrogenase YdfG n=1 Tax=Saccharopolyspora spinosa TaxID=60894 RepID=A0A2N3Y1T3_SACSN|nr:SDR family oxidoreductase [Saccharopolyspora spinosa]PKW16865.1 NADP-dependent 3-hydroxy acid dehydrogenase YdfG [Saccharopolyspora spinosa]